MSWDAYLYDGSGESVGEWNYTFNTNPMLNMAAAALGFGDSTWWTHLDGTAPAEGSGYLRKLIGWMTDNADRCREMNPRNGWGSYASLLPVLAEMADAGAVARDGHWRVYF